MTLKKASIGIAVLGILVSATYCNSSSILSIVNPRQQSATAAAAASSRQLREQAGQTPDLVKFFQRQMQNSNVLPRGFGKNVTLQRSDEYARQFGGGWGGGWGGGSGWGWPATSNNADLYSLLAGLAFLTTLFAALYGLFNSTGSVTVINATGRRRKRGADNFNLDGGLGFMDILKSVGIALDSPWWNQNAEADSSRVVPFSLI